MQRGDRVAIILPQRPETAISHIATYQMGAIALPLSHLFGPNARCRLDLNLRSLMSSGEAVGPAVMDWAQSRLGVTINEIFGQTEMNYVIGGCASLFAPEPGAMGRAYPGRRIALLNDADEEVAAGEVGEIAVWRDGDPVVFLEYWNNAEATRAKFSAGWRRTGDLATRDAEGFYWSHRRCDQERWLPHRPGRDRGLPAQTSDCPQRPCHWDSR